MVFVIVQNEKVDKTIQAQLFRHEEPVHIEMVQGERSIGRIPSDNFFVQYKGENA